MEPVITVVPCLNESESIGGLVQALKQYGDVVVVDDGSTDETYHKASASGAYLVWHDMPQGIAASVIDGWRVALGRGAERIAVMDAGGSHNPDELERLLAEDMHLVIGSRFVEGGQYLGGRRWRRLGSRFAAIMCNLAQSGPWIHDWTSGYRVYSRRAVDALLGQKAFAKMHAWQIEVLGLAREMGLMVVETPITYTAGRSSLRLSGVIEALTVWLQLMHHRGPAR